MVKNKKVRMPASMKIVLLFHILLATVLIVISVVEGIRFNSAAYREELIRLYPENYGDLAQSIGISLIVSSALTTCYGITTAHWVISFLLRSQFTKHVFLIIVVMESYLPALFAFHSLSSLRQNVDASEIIELSIWSVLLLFFLFSFIYVLCSKKLKSYLERDPSLETVSVS